MWGKKQVKEGDRMKMRKMRRMLMKKKMKRRRKMMFLGVLLG